ncbi:copper resistance CopC family protein [Cryobacterium zhongshanensis]|uniref:Copper resistance protein CopC n=1 Tax=Cryobacterium zhongshanensis TaxID=2928153 RepID=A0AA41QTV7_9MICO|nr:copper resistance CopC family protein [Cryobacterium zhongshanensis]MCI4657595.1 copper resistance protein CopC [Cryobacterium zhongshanensis]
MRQNMIPFPRARWAMSALALVTLVALSVAAGAAPAATAHDQVLSTSPTTGENVDTAPKQVAMVFSDDILSVGAIMLIVDDQGRNWADGTLKLDRATVTQPLAPGLPNGAYEVRWRVVSADGHPIAGTFPFSVGTVTAGSGSASAGPASSGPATVSPQPGAADAGPAQAPTGAIGGGLPLAVVALLGAGGGIAVLVVVLLLTSLWKRRRSA